MPRPAVTVLMPCRDAAAHVARAAGSILSQTGVDLSLLAIDDGSRDATPQILKALAARDPRLRVLSQDRRGLVAALNHGLSRVETRWVARQDADDVSHPARLSVQLGLTARDPAAQVIGCRIRGFPRGLITDGMRRYEEWQNSLLTHQQMESELFVESPLAHASALIRSQALRAAGGWREFDGPEDWDLWARLLAQKARFAKSERVLYFWREHEDRVTRKDPRMAPDKFRAAKLEALCAGPLAGRDGVELWSWGEQGRSWRNDLAARLPGLSYRPVNPRAVMAGREKLPPLPRDDKHLLLVAFGAWKVRKWFKNELARRVGHGGKVFLLIG